ncbi:zinc ribbon domain-containing protein [Pseudomonas mosselii]|uniref:zinc ribbon domain-containing protein n=1 Tax=Pseudomonas mosselii TaxID=78327 RepID=UPI002DBACD1E|nr:zinc ribbon domain-containing protein [Pseudomonas mosselii]MEB5930973.1 zinc ribbon domain-containing protein [Pseudomonas mosselii]
MDGIVGLVSLAVFVGIWWWLVKLLRKSGRGFITRHLLGCTAGWMASLLVAGIAVSTGIVEPKTAEVAGTTQAIKPGYEYEIVKDESREGRPRKVEVLLSRRLTDAELADVSKKIRDDSDVGADKTYIGYRVRGQTFGSYWANASFEPQYQGNVIALSAADYETLTNRDLSDYQTAQGVWLRDGALGHLMVLYTMNGKYFIDSVFAGGGKNREEYLAKPLPDGALRLETPDNGFGEYYVVSADGTLQGWGENGVYMTLLPRSPTANREGSHKEI